jgi:hypothetical protein
MYNILHIIIYGPENIHLEPQPKSRLSHTPDELDPLADRGRSFDLPGPAIYLVIRLVQDIQIP